MSSSRVFNFISDQPEQFKEKLLSWASSNQIYCLLNSNDYSDQNRFLPGKTTDFLLAAGTTDSLVAKGKAWEKLKLFSDKNKGKWIFGHLSYDLKNQVENLSSDNPDNIGFPLLHFFVPEVLIEVKGEEIHIHAESQAEPEEIFEKINHSSPLKEEGSSRLFKNKVNEKDYRNTVSEILKDIKYGDVYELNYCIEFFAEKSDITPGEVYMKLNNFSPAPFSALYKFDSRYLISASPERFLAKRGEKIFSQPIKGTTRRGKTKNEDEQLIEELRNNQKERSENIMIVDLVRNDLSRSCIPGSVVVDELCGIYTFPHVHQMISTVSGTVNPDMHPVDVIKNAFPMGSMTGAPKIRAMELIEKYEATGRGLYSGSVGYFTPEGDFDFNVVIRSLQYNMERKYLSVMAGSAITALSDPEKEYEECLLKAQALMKVLG